MLAVLSRPHLDIRSDAWKPGGLDRVLAVATLDALVAAYIEELISSRSTSFWRRWRRRRDVRLLAKYAHWLLTNQRHPGTLAGRALSQRDLILHRLWPVAGHWLPRVVDMVMCIVMSAPGLVWFAFFMGMQGIWGWVVAAIATVCWTAMLLRTSLKPWVPPALPDWSRLREPRALARQSGAALLIAFVGLGFFGPYVGVVAFVTAWLAIGLTVGFGQTLTTSSRAQIVHPEGVLRYEHKVSRFSALIVFPALWLGLANSLTLAPTAGLNNALTGVLSALYVLLVGETVASAVWRRYLSMIIASVGVLSIRPARLFSRMHQAGLMRLSGISYQFRHDQILVCLADRLKP